MVRRWTTVHLGTTGNLPEDVGCGSPDVLAILPPEQWQGGGCCQVHEETDLRCLDWPFSELGYIVPCSSIETLHHAKTGCHLPRSCLGTQCKTPCLPTDAHSHLSGNGRSRQLREQLSRPRTKLETTTTNTHGVSPTLHAVGSHVAIQNPTSKMWDIYGLITAVGPCRRYFVRTQSG